MADRLTSGLPWGSNYRDNNTSNSYGNNMGNNYGNDTGTESLKIGTWDPSEINKSSSSSSSNYQPAASNSWTQPSQPAHNYNNSYDSQQYSNQLANQASNLSLGSQPSRSSPDTSMYYYSSQQQPTQRYQQQSQPAMPPLPNISSYQSEIQPARPSDSRNWRSPAQTTYNTYSQSNLSYSTPTATDVQYQQQRSQFTVGQSWESFQNPLNQAEEDEERPEAIVERLKQKAADAKAVKEELQRKPNIISKAGLALIEKDLLDAAKPFETVESLQQCREKQLGLLSNEPTSYGGDAQKKEETEFVNLPPLVSALSAEAKEFIPSPSRRDYTGVQLLVTSTPNNKHNRGERPAEIPKLDLQISPDTERAYLKPSKVESRYSPSLPLLNRSYDTASQTESTECSSVVEDRSGVYKRDVLWNPLNGPAPGINLRRESWPLLRNEVHDETVCPNKKDMLSKSCIVQGKSNKFDSEDDCPHDFEATLSERKPIVYRYPCMDSLHQRFRANKHGTMFFPMLGLHSLEDLGFTSEAEVLKMVRQKIKLQRGQPTQLSQKSSEENEEAALKLVNDCVYELACNPASFDEAVPKDLVPKLNAFNLNQSSIEKIVDLIYEACVLEQNFRYLGGQLCDILSRSTGGLPGFRTTLLKKAQKEFESMAKALDGTKEELTRALGFTQYTAELFLSLTMAEQDGTMVRFSVLGRAILGVVEKLIKHPDNDDCIQCAVRVLKLTIISLEDALQNDGKDSTTKLANILDQLTSLSNDASSKLNNLSKNLLKGLLKLREQNWGRAPADEPHKPQDEPQTGQLFYPTPPGQDPNYILNEPVFFTPQGVEYTTADAADPEFYQQHLAHHQLQAFEPDVYDQYLYEDYSFNPADDNVAPYAAWSAGDQFDAGCAEDDYDQEFDNFLRQMP